MIAASLVCVRELKCRTAVSLSEIAPRYSRLTGAFGLTLLQLCGDAFPWCSQVVDGPLVSISVPFCMPDTGHSSVYLWPLSSTSSLRSLHSSAIDDLCQRRMYTLKQTTAAFCLLFDAFSLRPCPMHFSQLSLQWRMLHDFIFTVCELPFLHVSIIASLK